MERPEAPSGQRSENDAAVSARRFAVILGEPAGGSACRIEAPARLLRIWSLLQATHDQIEQTALPPEGMPRLQRQLQAIRRELESTVSPSLAAELRRIVPSWDEAPSATGLKVECAMLTSWTGSLTMQMLSTLEAARRRLPGQPAAAALPRRPGTAPDTGPAAVAGPAAPSCFRGFLHDE